MRCMASPPSWSAASPQEVVSAVGADDLFVLRRVSSDRFAHLGGVGRATGWAGIIEIAEDELFDPASGVPSVVHRSAPEPMHVFGPYYKRAASLVRVNHDVVVVFGGDEPVDATDDDLLELGRFVADGLEEVAPAKRLADELEVLTALQALLQAPPESVTETLQRLAEHATRSLSCEVGIAYLKESGRIAVCDLRDGAAFDLDALLPAVVALEERGEFPKCVQQTAVDDLPAPISSADGVVAYYLMELREPEPGLLLLLHTTASAPRGFTLLCQSLGAQLVDAAGPLLAAAALRDRMRADLERAELDARCDHLTGLRNRLGWEEAVAAAIPCAECPIGIVMVDGRGLKTINDTHGHDAGDEVIRAIANTLTACIRDGDIVARLGGDEFALLLHDADEEVTTEIVTRIHAAIATTRLLNGIDVRVAIGAASDREGDLATAQRLADRRMLEAKRAVAQAETHEPGSPSGEPGSRVNR
jgi:diguanylate cyclase (GGDEF)-like protein